MVVLKKTRASTLMETLVATVLIVIVFMISSMLLNNLFSSSIKGRTHPVRERIHELRYRYGNGGLHLPYFDEMDGWEISVENGKSTGVPVVTFRAEKKGVDKSIVETMVYGE
ncbi:hypothetical protein [Pricia sp.]|uniref:hypothetical protein n=1 Tax=Pricia sp. TaxID=2268138 RepID=UPI00359486AC